MVNFEWNASNEFDKAKVKRMRSELSNNQSYENTAAPSDSRLASEQSYLPATRRELKNLTPLSEEGRS